MSEQKPDYRTQEELLHTLEHGAPNEQDAALARLADVGDAEALDAVITYLSTRLPQSNCRNHSHLHKCRKPKYSA